MRGGGPIPWPHAPGTEPEHGRNVECQITYHSLLCSYHHTAPDNQLQCQAGYKIRSISHKFQIRNAERFYRSRLSLALARTRYLIPSHYLYSDDGLRGIGLESAILFASEGASVVLADINLPAAEKAAKIIEGKYPNAKTIAVKTDVGKESDIKALVEDTVSKFGRLDIMVYCIVIFDA